MKVCPDAESAYKDWREQFALTWVHGSILYCVGVTHTIDGQGMRHLPDPKKTRIADPVTGGPCINAGLIILGGGVDYF